MISLKTVCFARAALVVGIIAAGSLVDCRAGGKTSPEQQAQQILQETGVSGGLIVHLGCGDGELTAAFSSGGRYLVHGLDRDAKNVELARRKIQSLGLYGKVSVDHWTGDRLPYIDNLVNLLVIEDPSAASAEEINRVLAPLGTAVTKDRTKTVKPWPEEINEWTHYLHDASGNAVADDTAVGVPRRMQWLAPPRWPRGHDYTPNTSALVTAAGRIFYLQDEGTPGATDPRFDRWALCARDAFNGLLLWKRQLPDWGGEQWDSTLHWSVPMSLPRRLVADGDRVYVTLGYRAPVSVLDARSGELLRVEEETGSTDEIVLCDGVLLVRRRKNIPDYPAGVRAWDVTVRTTGAEPLADLPEVSPGDDTLIALSPETGQILWQQPERRIVTLSLAASGGKVCYHNFEELVCLDLSSGNELWRVDSRPWPDVVGTALTLVMYEDLVLMNSSRGLVARSVATGEELWRGPRVPRSAPRQPADLFVAGGLVWGGLTPEMPMGTIPKQRSDVPRQTGTAVVGLDPRTGRVVKSIDVGKLVSPGHHVRCYRSKATDQYLLWPKRGIELIDIAGGTDHMRCDWARGECSLGVTPANGLLYLPPHPCACYVGVILSGFNALAAEKTEGEKGRRGNGESEGSRLERGPAYNTLIPRPQSLIPSPSDWPTYRHDTARSGFTTTPVPTDIEPRWKTELGGRLSAPVVAGDQLLVAAVDQHTVWCLDRDSGAKLWSFTAGGRVDSPPTVHGNLALFGCRDGHVYCLRAADGQLVWRFRAAPDERRVVAFGQIESAWPVHGSLLVNDGLAYFAAGRSSFLDGGIYLYAVNPADGKIVHRAHLDGPWPDVKTDEGHPYHVEGAQADILVADSEGREIHMRQSTFDLKLTRLETPAINDGGERATGLHLAATSGFLDDTWFHRTHWRYGRTWPGIYFSPDGPKSGQILVFNPQTTYAVRVFTRQAGHNPLFTPGVGESQLTADDNQNETVRPKGYQTHRGQPPQWSVNLPIRAVAMVLARETLFLAGPPDVVPDDDPYAAIEGRRGALLQAVSTTDGERLSEYQLDSVPVFDGLIAAGRRLFLCDSDGSVTCLAGR